MHYYSYVYSYAYAGRQHHSARVHSAAVHRAVGAGGSAGQREGGVAVLRAGGRRARGALLVRRAAPRAHVRPRPTHRRAPPVFLSSCNPASLALCLIVRAFMFALCRLRVAREARPRRLAVGRRAVRLHDDQIPLSGCAPLTPIYFTVYLIPTGLRSDCT